MASPRAGPPPPARLGPLPLRSPYLEEAAHFGAQGAELLRRRLGVELPAQQLLRDVRVAVVGDLGDAAEERAQRLGALGRRRLLGRRHRGEGRAAGSPAPLAATGTAAARTQPTRVQPSFLTGVRRTALLAS